MLDTLLLRPSLHFTTLHPTTLHSTCRHFTSCRVTFTQLHFTTLSFSWTTFKIPYRSVSPNITIRHLTYTSLYFTLFFFVFLYILYIKLLHGIWKISKLTHSFSNYQHNAKFLYSSTICTLHYDLQHVSSSTLLILRTTNCITTASGIVSLCKLPYGMQVESGLQL